MPTVQEPENGFRATVYYSPDQWSRDLRRGRCLFVSSALELVAPRLEPELSDYVQVSPAGQPFGEELDVPSLPDLPFDPPTNGSTTKPDDIAPEELVRLVRFARNARVAGDLADASLAERSRGEPILSIRTLDDGFEVWTGWVSGPLAGGGCILRIQKTKSGYQLLDVQMWVS